jgi:hypothetical protein
MDVEGTLAAYRRGVVEDVQCSPACRECWYRWGLRL